MLWGFNWTLSLVSVGATAAAVASDHHCLVLWVAGSVQPAVLTADRAAAVAEQDAAVASTSSAPAAPAPVYKTVKQLRLRSTAAYLPHPDKESYGGEDAHFVSNVSGGAIGVADGTRRGSVHLACWGGVGVVQAGVAVCSAT